MVVAVVAGIVVGGLSLIPFWVATKKIRTVNPTHSLDMLAPFLLTIVLSLVILIAGMVICKLVAPGVVAAYAIAELLAFVVGVIVFGVLVSKRR